MTRTEFEQKFLQQAQSVPLEVLKETLDFMDFMTAKYRALNPPQEASTAQSVSLGSAWIDQLSGIAHGGHDASDAQNTLPSAGVVWRMSVSICAVFMAKTSIRFRLGSIF